MSTPELTEALDALEGMVAQYMADPNDDRHFGHSFMSAGEDASDVLARLRPERWAKVGDGLRFIGDEIW